MYPDFITHYHLSDKKPFLNLSDLKGDELAKVLEEVGICSASILPGQAFLKRFPVFLITAGVQSVMILAISITLAVWK